MVIDRRRFLTAFVGLGPASLAGIRSLAVQRRGAVPPKITDVRIVPVDRYLFGRPDPLASPDFPV